LLVCICLIGLVLLQRSEGGALGMGGGGGALVSGRGAADALARMTQVAGGFFLVTSLGLTFLSGAAGANSTGGSVFDNAPAAVAPATLPASATPEEGAAVDAVTDVAAVEPASAAPTTPAPEAARAAPLPSTPTTTAPPRPTRTADATSPRPAAPTSTAPRNTAPTNGGPNRPLVLPNSSGGAALTLDPSQLADGESVQADGRLEAVRRERAGPDQ
jgi:preprotein translocase subunit SecG